ncbi:FAD-dependent oxidoreductase, partial [Halothiobacillus sp.]|uniref:NAD(P)/FAD-dependent oxidoreductase n=1 Tax=Halothiobacillus sp. TaxID=1891311 RepID=UPI002627720B
MIRPRLIVIGNGMAGMRTVEELLKLKPDLYDITVFGDEPYPNYNRIMLSPVLAKEQTIPDIILNDENWYAEHGITLYKGIRVDRIERTKREVITQDGQAFPYDRVLIATGSRAFIPPLPGADLPGVVGFRSIADVDAMLAVCREGGHAVVIGGGLLGLEAAAGLVSHGMNVTVLHRNGNVMDRQLDGMAGRILEKTLEDRGISIRLNAHTASLHGTDRVEAVRLKDGTELPADLVVMAAGIRPNIDVALNSR